MNKKLLKENGLFSAEMNLFNLTSNAVFFLKNTA